MKVIDKENRIWSLLMKCLSGECNEIEEEELKLWRNMNYENSAFYFEVNDMLRNVNSAMNTKDINSEVAWQKVKSRIDHNSAEHLTESLIEGEKGKEFKTLSLMWRVAASVLLIFSVGLGYYLWEMRASQINTLTAYGSEVRHITLSDGTNVAINGGAVFKYPSEFKGEEREVSLTGEAFFDVISDKQHPFIINVAEMEVHVLGTSFNIKAIDGSPEATVVVETGVVQVIAGESSVLIREGETALLNRNDKTLVKYKNSDTNFKAWNTKQIKFVNMPLNEAFATIENTYKVKIEFSTDSLIDNKTIDANFDKQTIEFILKTICETYHLQYLYHDDTYVISGK